MLRLHWVLVLAGWVVLGPAEARAGMPMVTLTEIARLRVQTISFFLLCFVASAWGIQAIWNAVRKDFPTIPRLSFGRAVGVVTLWGLLFLLVLTMISGARELMTPGAWRREGLTYVLRADPRPPSEPDRLSTSSSSSISSRRQALDRLRVALWTYARGHDGRFPKDDTAAEIPEEVWEVPSTSGLRYLYRGGQTAGEGSAPLAFEPGVFGDERLVLLTSGAVRMVPEVELRRVLEPSARASR